MSKITTIVGWDGDHSTHKECVTRAFEDSEVLFMPSGSSRNEVAVSAIPKNAEGKWEPTMATIIMLRGCPDHLVKQLSVLAKKGTTVHKEWDKPWEGEASDDNAVAWSDGGVWPEEPVEDTIDDLFGDDLFDDEEDAGELLTTLDEVPDSTAGGVQETAVPEDAVRVAETPVGDKSEEDFASPLDAVLGAAQDSPAAPEPESPAQGAVKSDLEPSLPSLPSPDDDDDGMESVESTELATDDFVPEFIERDVDIPASGGPAKNSPREKSSERDGDGTRGGNSGEDMPDLPPSDNFVPSYAGLPEETGVAPLAPKDGGKDGVSLEDFQDVRGVDEEEEEHREQVRAMSKRTVGYIDDLDKPEVFVTRNNPSAVVEPRIPDDNDVMVKEPEPDPPYIKDLPEAARSSQRDKVNEGALGEYTRQDNFMGNSNLYYFGGSSGGTGKSFVTYGMASATAAAYDKMRESSTTNNNDIRKKINRPVYLIEADYTNPDLDHYLSRDGQRRVNTIRPLIQEMKRRNYSMNEEEVLQMVSSCTTRAQGSNLRILACPADLREVETDRKVVVYTILAIINALLSQPGGAVVFVDGVNISTPAENVLTKHILKIGVVKVFLVVNPDKKEEAVRAMEFLTTSEDGERTTSSGYGRNGRVIKGYGLQTEDIAVFLNQIPVVPNTPGNGFYEAFQDFQMETRMMPSGGAFKYKGFENTGWAGEYENTKDRDSLAYACLHTMSRPSGGGMLELKPLIDKLTNTKREAPSRNKGGGFRRLLKKTFG